MLKSDKYMKDARLVEQLKGVQLRLGFIVLADKSLCEQQIKPMPDEMAWELGIEATSDVGMFLSAFKMYLEKKGCN